MQSAKTESHRSVAIVIGLVAAVWVGISGCGSKSESENQRATTARTVVTTTPVPRQVSPDEAADELAVAPTSPVPPNGGAPPKWTELEERDIDRQEYSSPNRDSTGSRLPESRNGAKRYAIIHADDAGMCRSVNRATIDAMEQGAVSSASIMVPCPAFEQFAEYARSHPDRDYGIHLTLNAEFRTYRWGPVAPKDDVPSLVDSRGFLWEFEQQVAQHAVAAEVELELRAQIERALQLGVPLSHLDSHMGTLWTRPDLCEIYVNLGIEYDLPVLFPRHPRSFNLTSVHPEVKRQVPQIVEVLSARDFPVLDAAIIHYVSDSYSHKRDHYLRAIRNLQPGVTEIIVHCGYNDRELAAITKSSRLRDGDRRAFTDPRVIREIEREGVEVITWRQFRQMTADRRREANRVQ
jgi:hypothetical protein